MRHFTWRLWIHWRYLIMFVLYDGNRMWSVWGTNWDHGWSLYWRQAVLCSRYAMRPKKLLTG